ncbi:hypothetical protein OQA88_9534 [Cercophora sp. LCS_1]
MALVCGEAPVASGLFEDSSGESSDWGSTTKNLDFQADPVGDDDSDAGGSQTDEAEEEEDGADSNKYLSPIPKPEGGVDSVKREASNIAPFVAFGFPDDGDSSSESSIRSPTINGSDNGVYTGPYDDSDVSNMKQGSTDRDHTDSNSLFGPTSQLEDGADSDNGARSNSRPTLDFDSGDDSDGEFGSTGGLFLPSLQPKDQLMSSSDTGEDAPPAPPRVIAGVMSPSPAPTPRDPSLLCSSGGTSSPPPLGEAEPYIYEVVLWGRDEQNQEDHPDVNVWLVETMVYIKGVKAWFRNGCLELHDLCRRYDKRVLMEIIDTATTGGFRKGRALIKTHMPITPSKPEGGYLYRIIHDGTDDIDGTEH